MVKKLGTSAEEAGKNNVSFLSYFLLGDLEKCLDILVSSNRIPEAAFFARTYLPSEISRVVALWRVQLGKVNEKAGQSLADPVGGVSRDNGTRKTIIIRTDGLTPSPQADYPNLFPDFNSSLAAQKMLAGERRQVIPAQHYREILVRTGGACDTGHWTLDTGHWTTLDNTGQLDTDH